MNGNNLPLIDAYFVALIRPPRRLILVGGMRDLLLTRRGVCLIQAVKVLIECGH